MLAHHALLVLALAALAGASLRLSSRIVPTGPERLLAAAVMASAAAVACSLGLGLFGLGADTFALTAAAVALWLAARYALPVPDLSPSRELAGRWNGMGRPAQLAAGAAGGVAGAYLAWLLANPSLGEDGIVYHLTEAAMWVSGGSPGSIEPITYEFPVGNYPVTNEVVLTWLTGISRGFTAALLWTPSMLALAAGSGWVALRRLGVPALACALAVVAVCTLPVTIDQLRGPSTDIPALAWLVTAGALALGSREHPRLVFVALLAAALAVGTKTTTLPFALAVAVPALWVRRPLAWRPLALAAAGCMVVAGGWYLRNLVQHGSPFWPFVASPWGDPVPAYLNRFDATFLDSPRATLGGRVDDYLGFLGAGPLLLVAAVVAGLAARSRAVGLAAAATVAGLVLWARSPYTGSAGVNPVLDLSLATTRYLLPVFAAAALAIALAARRGGLLARAATALLGIAVAWNLARDAGLGLPRAPAVWVVVAGAVAGLMVVAAARRAPGVPRRAGAVACAVLVAAALGAASLGFDRRFGDVPGFSGPLVAWAAGQERFRDGGLTISFAPTPIAPLAGSMLQNRLELIPAGASCDEVRRRARAGWVVIRDYPLKRFLHPFTAQRCLAGVRPVFDDGNEFRVYRLDGRR